MKKIILFLLSLFIFCTNVYACGEIKSIRVEGATVKEISDMSYLVRLNEPKEMVMLEVTSDYDFVRPYGPRMVNTSKKTYIKIDGYKCGFGIYTYTVLFEVNTQAIAENTEDDTSQVDTSSTDNEELPKYGLKNIEIAGYNLDFHPKTFTYTLEVPENVTSLDITTTKINEQDIVTITDNASNLSEENNTIIITVTGSENNIRYYEIKVERVAPKNDNNYLASLQVTGYTLNFESSKTEYSLKVPNNISTLEVVAIPEEKNATTSVVGNESIVNGSKIIVTVTAENGSTKDYTIEIVKEFDFIAFISENKIYIVVSLLIILLIILIIISQKKKKAKKGQGPSEIGAPITTAGEIRTPQITSEPTENAKSTSESRGPAPELKIITPTDVEPENKNVDEAQSPTEVFQL